MSILESETLFKKWITEERLWLFLNWCLFSLFLHALLFILIYSVKPLMKMTSLKKTSSSAPIEITLQPLEQSKPEKNEAPLRSDPRTLTDQNKNSAETFSVPEKKQQQIPSRGNQKNAFSQQTPIQKKFSSPSTHKDLSHFLPQENPEYMKELREESKTPPRIQAQGGDVPVDGNDLLTPRNGPRVVDRYAVKNLSLYQFSQEFKERFGALWNSKQRWVPPTSPLRPGDVVFYKVYINTDGRLDHFENLTKKIKPEKDYSDLDSIFSEVIAGVFPMSVPDGLPKQSQIDEVLAIQVVDGSSIMMHFSN